MKMDDDAFFGIVEHLAVGVGIRKTATLCEVKPDTVMRVNERMGRHALRVLQEFVSDVYPDEVQCDEIWTFVDTKQGHLEGLDRFRVDLGDSYVWIAFDPSTKVVLGIVIGKRTKENAVLLIERLRAALGEDHFPLITTDQLPHYEDALVVVYGFWEIDEDGDRVAVVPEELKLGQVKKTHEGNHLVSVERSVVFGSEEEIETDLLVSDVSTSLNTSHIERFNGKLRGSNGRFVRKTLSFSKDREMLMWSLLVTVSHEHFCQNHRGLRRRRRGRPPKSGARWHQRTPMMALGRTDRRWDVADLVRYHPLRVHEGVPYAVIGDSLAGAGQS